MTDIRIEHGFIIRKNEGYLEVISLDYWVLTSDGAAASLYTEKEEAEQVIHDFELDDCKIIEVNRLIAFWPHHPLTDKELNKLKEFVK